MVFKPGEVVTPVRPFQVFLKILEVSEGHRAVRTGKERTESWSFTLFMVTVKDPLWSLNLDYWPIFFLLLLQTYNCFSIEHHLTNVWIIF